MNTHLKSAGWSNSSEMNELISFLLQLSGSVESEESGAMERRRSHQTHTKVKLLLQTQRIDQAAQGCIP